MSESTNKSYREFWMLNDQLQFGSEVSSAPKDHACIPLVMRIPIQSNAIHVIEIAALDDLKKSYAELKKQLSVDFQYQEIERLKKENEEIKIKMSGVAGATVGTVSREYNLKIEKLIQALKVAEDALKEIETYDCGSDGFSAPTIESNYKSQKAREVLAEIKKIKES